MFPVSSAIDFRLSIGTYFCYPRKKNETSTTFHDTPEIIHNARHHRFSGRRERQERQGPRRAHAKPQHLQGGRRDQGGFRRHRILHQRPHRGSRCSHQVSTQILTLQSFAQTTPLLLPLYLLPQIYCSCLKKRAWAWARGKGLNVDIFLSRAQLT